MALSAPVHALPADQLTFDSTVSAVIPAAENRNLFSKIRSSQALKGLAALFLAALQALRARIQSISPSMDESCLLVDRQGERVEIGLVLEYKQEKIE